jgi:hypothetical protein
MTKKISRGHDVIDYHKSVIMKNGGCITPDDISILMIDIKHYCHHMEYDFNQCIKDAVAVFNFESGRE